MKQFQWATSFGCTILAGLALACSGEPGFDAVEPAPPLDSSIEPNGTEEPLDLEAEMLAEVTSEEASVLEAYYARSSLGAPTSTAGRLLRWDDAMLTVDDVLQRAARLDDPALVEKGYAETAAANPNSGGSIQFWRPDIGLYYVIIEDAVPSSVFTAVSDVLTEWSSLSVDCIGVGTFQAIRRASYNALSQTQKDVSYEITVQYVPKTTADWPCRAGEVGCASFPADQQIKLTAAGSFVPRMAIGKRVSIDSDALPSTDITSLKKTLRHEFGHTLGFDHQKIAASAIYIPGTQICGVNCFAADMYPSVMRTGSAGGVFQPDDDKSLRTLYANDNNRANDDCSYVDTFRVLAALP